MDTEGKKKVGAPVEPATYASVVMKPGITTCLKCNKKFKSPCKITRRFCNPCRHANANIKLAQVEIVCREDGVHRRGYTGGSKSE